MQVKDIPNLLTLLRLALIIPVVYLIVSEAYLEALIVFFIAGLTDALDGFLAKKFRWQSYLGSILDPIADKFLLVAAYLALSYIGAIPWWLTFAVILRDAVIVLGALIYNYSITELEQMQPSVVSKINTFTQIALVLLIILNLSINILDQSWINYFVYIVFTTTLLSGADYVWTWGLKAWKHKHD